MSSYRPGQVDSLAKAGLSPEVRAYLSTIGRRGGRRSRRVLEPAVARRMVKVREARRAYARFAASCFWSYDPALTITYDDIPWVVEQLRKNGGRSAWEVAARLCR